MRVVRRVSVRRVGINGPISAAARRTVDELHYPVIFEMLEPRLLRADVSDSTMSILVDPTLATEAQPAQPAVDEFDRLDLGSVESAMGVAVQPDGKVIVFGLGGFVIRHQYQADQIADKLILARYNVDGTLDTSFGTQGGYTTIDAGGFSSDGSDVVVAADGTIWVATTQEIGMLLKFAADGSTYQTVNGVRASEFALQADGKIVYTGDGIVGRLNADGSTDTTFGDGGTVKLLPGEMYMIDDIGIDGQGRIVVSGYSHHSTSEHDTPAGTGTVLRLTASGSLDASFGNGGVFRLATEGRRWEQFEALHVRADGSIVLGGHLFKQWRNPASSSGYSSTGTWMLVQLKADGTLDDVFGDHGVLWSTTGPFNSIYDLTETADGWLVGAIYSNDAPAIAIFDHDGNHTLFSGSGVSSGAPVWTTNLALAPDGSIVAIGHVSIQDAGGIREQAKADADLLVTRFTLPTGPGTRPRTVLQPAPMPPVTETPAPGETPIDEPSEEPSKEPSEPRAPSGVLGGGASNDPLFSTRERSLFADFERVDGDELGLPGEDEADEELLPQIL